MRTEMTKRKVYPTYKGSGVEWLGDVPAHWDVKRLKFFAKVNMGQSPDSEDCTIDEKGIPFLQGNAEFGQLHPTPKHWCEVAKKIADEEDILLSVRAPVGQLNLADQRYGIGRGLCALSPNSLIELKYLWFLLSLIREELASVSTGSTYDAVTVADVMRLTGVIPAKLEQSAIASFLDRETAKLDQLIKSQLRMIELLQEKRQALISHAVTKGLNPDAPMNDSGVEWLGEVPEHWTVSRNKVVFSEIDERSVSDEGELLTVSHITGVTLRSEKNVNMFMAETLEGYKLCHRGDLVINTMWAWMGALGVSPHDGLVSPSYNVYRPRAGSELYPAYYDYLCRIPQHIVTIKAHSSGVWESRLRLYPDAFLSMRMCLPPLEEQIAIVEYLDKMLSAIDTLIEKSSRSIELMREHRTALISAAVTGKIDVREVS